MVKGWDDTGLSEPDPLQGKAATPMASAACCRDGLLGAHAALRKPGGPVCVQAVGLGEALRKDSRGVRAASTDSEESLEESARSSAAHLSKNQESKSVQPHLYG